MKYEFYTLGTMENENNNHLIAFGVGFTLKSSVEWVYDLETHTITLHESIAGSVFHRQLEEYISDNFIDLYSGKYEYTQERRDQLAGLLAENEMKKRDYGLLH